MTRRPPKLRLILCAFVAAFAGACSGPVTDTPFDRAASDAASLSSAGAETLRAVHAEPARVTVEYSQGATFNYHELLAPIPGELPTLEGAPDEATTSNLVALLQAAVADLGNPCLLPDCDWQSQVNDLDAAKQALLKATE
jgi:hypothetical protein